MASFFTAKPPPLSLPGCVSGIAAFSYHSLPHWGRGTASAVDRVLSFIACLRRSFPLFFIPLEPYPARSARHLPHAGKAWIQKYRFPPIQPPPLRGTSFRRKEGVSTRAPFLGRGCRAQRGGVGFLFCGEAASSFPSRLYFGYSRILVSQPSPRGNAIKLSGRTFLAPHRGSCPKGLCKRTGFLGVKRRENPVRRHFERSEMRGLRSGIA